MSEVVGSARAPVNIALVKYWGKRDERLNIPAAGSLSVTLADLEAHTTVAFDPALTDDLFHLNGARVQAPAALAKVARVLDGVRRATGMGFKARVDSVNTFPTGAGIASSAAGLAALALAATRAAGWSPSPQEVSVLARLGSGSASRSIHGGFVEWYPGERADGSDSYAESIAGLTHWPLSVGIFVVDPGPKWVPSTRGMAETARTSPYYTAWLAAVEEDLPIARSAILERDFSGLEKVSERSCLAMHAAMIAARPSLRYWRSGTLALLDALDRIRSEGARAFYTIDAGPNVKVFTPPGDPDGVLDRLSETPCVVHTLRSEPGSGARLVEEGVARVDEEPPSP